MGIENLHQTSNDTIKIKEQELYKAFLLEGLDKKYPNLKVKYIQENIFAIGDNENVYSYCTEKGDPIFNIGIIKNFQFMNGEIIMNTGYIEKNELGINKLYYFDRENGKTGNIIDPYSKEYYKARSDIYFNYTLIRISTFKKNSVNSFSEDKLEQIQQNILEEIDTGAITIDTLEILHEQGKLKDDFFSLAIKKVVKEKLLLQCTDERLDKVKQGITREKIDKYLKKGYISPQLAEIYKHAIETKEKNQSKKSY